MKKYFKSGLLALALIVGVSGAVVSKVQAAPKADDPTYNWTRIAGDPQSGEVDPLLGKTVTQAEANYGCSGTSDVCAHGAPTQSGQSSADIFLN